MFIVHVVGNFTPASVGWRTSSSSLPRRKSRPATAFAS